MLCNAITSLSILCDCYCLQHNVKLRREDRKEEENFTKMVDSYKRKLFGNVSDSRWFE